MTSKTEVGFIVGQKQILYFDYGDDLKDFLNSRETKPGTFLMVNGWPHIVIETADQGKKIAAMRPPYSVSIVY